MADENAQIAVVPTVEVEDVPHPTIEMNIREFVPARTVYDGNGKKYLVPATPKANRHSSQMIISKIRYLLDKKLDELAGAGKTVDVRVLKDLTSAASTLHAMSMDAYGGGKVPLKENQVADFERMAAGLLEAAASGTAKGLQNNFDAELKKIQGLGKTKPAEPVIEA